VSGYETVAGRIAGYQIIGCLLPLMRCVAFPRSSGIILLRLSRYMKLKDFSCCQHVLTHPPEPPEAGMNANSKAKGRFDPA
jgi:hypothetical protein